MTGKCITLIAFRHDFTENTVGRNKETADKKKKGWGELRAHQKLFLLDYLLNAIVFFQYRVSSTNHCFLEEYTVNLGNLPPAIS